MHAPFVRTEVEIITVSVHEILRETADIITLYLTLPVGKLATYTAGQYITVYLPDLDVPEGKAYSLSSCPQESRLAISVKNVGGPYSTRLHQLKKGDVLLISRPYGHFCPEANVPLVLLAGGIGISPMWSIIKSDVVDKSNRQINLWYSNRTARDIAFKSKISLLEKECDNFTAQYYISREAIKQVENVHTGRIQAFCAAEAAPLNAVFMVCGTVPFVRSMWQQLRDAGIPRSRIMTETFFETVEGTYHGNPR